MYRAKYITIDRPIKPGDRCISSIDPSYHLTYVEGDKFTNADNLEVDLPDWQNRMCITPTELYLVDDKLQKICVIDKNAWSRVTHLGPINPTHVKFDYCLDIKVIGRGGDHKVEMPAYEGITDDEVDDFCQEYMNRYGGQRMEWDCKDVRIKVARILCTCCNRY